MNMDLWSRNEQDFYHDHLAWSFEKGKSRFLYDQCYFSWHDHFRWSYDIHTRKNDEMLNCIMKVSSKWFRSRFVEKNHFSSLWNCSIRKQFSEMQTMVIEYSINRPFALKALSMIRTSCGIISEMAERFIGLKSLAELCSDQSTISTQTYFCDVVFKIVSQKCSEMRDIGHAIFSFSVRDLKNLKWQRIRFWFDGLDI